MSLPVLTCISFYWFCLLLPVVQPFPVLLAWPFAALQRELVWSTLLLPSTSGAIAATLLARLNGALHTHVFATAATYMPFCEPAMPVIEQASRPVLGAFSDPHFSELEPRLYFNPEYQS